MQLLHVKVSHEHLESCGRRLCSTGFVLSNRTTTECQFESLFISY